MTGPGGPADALEAAAHRLEQVARRLGEDGVTPDELRALADEVLRLGQEITDTLPRALRGLDEPPPR